MMMMMMMMTIMVIIIMIIVVIIIILWLYHRLQMGKSLQQVIIIIIIVITTVIMTLTTLTLLIIRISDINLLREGHLVDVLSFVHVKKLTPAPALLFHAVVSDHCHNDRQDNDDDLFVHTPAPALLFHAVVNDHYHCLHDHHVQDGVDEYYVWPLLIICRMWLYDDAKCDHEHNNWRITELYVSSKNGNFFRLLLEWFFRGILRVSLTFSGDFSLSFHLFFLESCKNSELKIVKWKHHGPINCQSYKSFSSEDFQWRTFPWNPHNVHSSVNVQYSLWLLERI